MRTIKEKVEKPGKIERIEKIIEREKKIDWNKVNKIRNEGKINLLTKIKKIVLAKQRT